MRIACIALLLLVVMITNFSFSMKDDQQSDPRMVCSLYELRDRTRRIRQSVDEFNRAAHNNDISGQLNITEAFLSSFCFIYPFIRGNENKWRGITQEDIENYLSALRDTGPLISFSLREKNNSEFLNTLLEYEKVLRELFIGVLPFPSKLFIEAQPSPSKLGTYKIIKYGVCSALALVGAYVIYKYLFTKEKNNQRDIL